MSKKEFKFAEGERVLCFHGPQLYEAKVMNTDVKEEEETGKQGPFYLVHYNGWKKSHDEWVPEARVLKLNEANLGKQKQIAAQHKVDIKGKRAHSEAKTSEKSGGKKRKDRSDQVETEEEHNSHLEVKIVLPDDLKHRLVDDWDKITRHQKLVTLPNKVPISKILDDYLNFIKSSRASKTQHIVSEVVNGLKVYFDHALPTILLYRFERHQFTQLMEENAEAVLCDVYGAEHLLRLFVKLPTLLAHTALDEKGMSHLVQCIHDLMKYLVRNAQHVFTGAYQSASQEYIKASA